MSTDKVVFESFQPFKRENNCTAQNPETLIFESRYYCDCAGAYIEKLVFQFSSFKNWPGNVNAILKYWIGAPLPAPPHESVPLVLNGSDKIVEEGIKPPLRAERGTMIQVSLFVNCAGANDPRLDGAECRLALVLWYGAAQPAVEIIRR